MIWFWLTFLAPFVFGGIGMLIYFVFQLIYTVGKINEYWDKEGLITE